MESHTIACYDRSDDNSESLSSSDLPLLPATTYVPPETTAAPQDLFISTDFADHSFRSQRHLPHTDDASPDPREFYYQYNHPFGGDGAADPPDGDVLTTSFLNTSNGSSTPLNESPVPYRPPSPSSRSSQTRPPSDVPLPKGRSSGNVTSGGRPQQQRHSSLKELVDRFNQNQDEVPPRPLGNTNTPPLGTSRPSSPPSASSRSTTTQISRSTGAKNREYNAPKSPQTPRTRPIIRHINTTPNTNDNPRSPASGNSRSNRLQQALPKRPLFGEIFSGDSGGFNASTRGISSSRRRRGSEGSMHSPNPVYSDNTQLDQDSGLTPSSPTSWYRDYTPSESLSHSTSRPVIHRRSRSDLTGTPAGTMHIDSFNKSMNGKADNASLYTTSASQSRPKSNSQSRIPVSSRRLSHTSDSGGSSPSTRANSALDRHPNPVSLPRKGNSALPVPSPKSPTSPTKTTILRSAPSGKRDRNHAQGSSDKSPSLKAYISAPPPKKSPPLRSSRPRQPVSKATTTASRARVVDRVTDLQKQSGSAKEPRSSRQKSRRLPELGNVDFAARRQKIQQAFNKTVQENAEKEERAVQRRRSAYEKEQREANEIKSQQAYDGPHVTEEQETVSPSGQNDTPKAIVEPEASTTEEKETIVTPHEGCSPDLRDLSGITNTEQVPCEVKGMDLENPNGPTEPDNYIESAWSPTTPSDGHPPSAVTVCTETTFDFEPQSEQPEPSLSHRTVLSQIMQMRESSPEVTDTSEDDDSLSGNDNRGSIQIMLQTPYFEGSVDNSSGHHERGGGADDSRSDEDRHRWSVSSYDSSLQGQRPSVEVSSGRTETAGSSFSIDDNSRLSTSTKESSKTPQPWVKPLFSQNAPPVTTERTNTQKGTHEQPTSETSSYSSGRYSTHMMQQYPGLAKQGGWDSKRVTQLYLQELAKGGFNKTHLLKSNDNRPAPRSEPERPSSRGTPGKKADGLTEDPIIVPESSRVPKSEYIQHRASLNFRDDWVHTSPSVTDWMQLAATDDLTPGVSKDGTETTPNREGAVTPKNLAQPSGPVVEGLGLSVRIQSPGDLDVPVIPPPLPDHAPPPPPERDDSALRQPELQLGPGQISPSVYSRNTHPTTLPNTTYVPTEHGPSTRGSDDSSLRQTNTTATSRTQGSSATSQDRSSADQSSNEAPPPKPSSPKSSPSPEQRRLKKRKHVIKELVDTEYAFGRDMTVVVDIYKGTSSSCLDLSGDDVKTLFGNSDHVVQFSMDFQDSLKQAAKSVYVLPRSQRWQSKRGNKPSHLSNVATDSQSSIPPELPEEEKDRNTNIGEAFMAHISRMEKVYSEYLKNHDAANKTLEGLMRKKNVSIWLKECRDWAADLTTAWDLDSLLVKPVQRIVKYPLLLTELLSATPEDHPDYAALADALRETTSISVRINDMKKRADVVGQIIGNRKRKESDVRAGLSKAFGRRTEKLKQQVGLSEMFSDKDYDTLSQRFSDNFFQLQLIMRDVELYSTEAQKSMNRFNEFVIAIESYITLAPSNYPELESKWCRFRLAVKDVVAVALPDHVGFQKTSPLIVRNYSY